ncbi:hypothetical protein XthCFBP4691_00075 [Xanthomonas theicola]|uniref:Transposase IS204/IS1001/IS1096/IS1165 DDE domain-containing protein n=1 Tax=Xanthomonas theicola TaxID=56464 RepID=A0A2S6ZM46_9XANT|nr:hypothetical protein XthCFBP4691_00075 [Xanthomonas theicola]
MLPLSAFLSVSVKSGGTRQRLAPSQRFVKRIGRHWDGIAAYCHPDHKIGRGRVEGLNNKIRGIPHSAYGDRDQDDLRLTNIASVLPPLPENARSHPHRSAKTRFSRPLRGGHFMR